MKKVARFLFDTWYGVVAAVIVGCVATGARGDILTEVAGRLGVGRRVLEERDFTGFYVRGEPEDEPRQLKLSGLVFHSAMGVESVKTREDGDVLRVEVRGGLARKGVDGNLNAQIDLPAGIREVQFGRERTTVWTRRVAEIWRKLGEIVVPKVEFVNTAPGDVLEYVRELLAYGAEDPEMEFKLVFDEARAGLRPVTLQMEGASAREVLRAVDEALGVWTELKGDGSGWEVWRVIRLEDIQLDVKVKSEKGAAGEAE